MPSIVIGSSLIGPDNETFKITDFLGNGAFGEVYRAVGEKSGNIVAVKLIPLGRHLSTLQQQSDRERQVKLYGHSCEMLLESLKPLIQQFNQQFQHGQITCEKPGWANVYSVPSGRNITIAFFEPRKSGIKVRGGEIIGGGWIGIAEGRSANLVLLKHGPDDLYGRWVVCEIGIMALANPQKLIGQFGITKETVIPFGFRDADFYDQMQYATGILHVFTYNFIDDPVDFFAQLLNEAVK